MPNLFKRIPPYILHKASGLAVVALNCVDHYLGHFGSKENRSKYDDLLA